jgi:hypothetical protein
VIPITTSVLAIAVCLLAAMLFGMLAAFMRLRHRHRALRHAHNSLRHRYDTRIWAERPAPGGGVDG